MSTDYAPPVTRGMRRRVDSAWRRARLCLAQDGRFLVWHCPQPGAIQAAALQAELDLAIKARQSFIEEERRKGVGWTRILTHHELGKLLRPGSAWYAEAEQELRHRRFQRYWARVRPFTLDP